MNLTCEHAKQGAFPIRTDVFPFFPSPSRRSPVDLREVVALDVLLDSTLLVRCLIRRRCFFWIQDDAGSRDRLTGWTGWALIGMTFSCFSQLFEIMFSCGLIRLESRQRFGSDSGACAGRRTQGSGSVPWCILDGRTNPPLWGQGHSLSPNLA